MSDDKVPQEKKEPDEAQRKSTEDKVKKSSPKTQPLSKVERVTIDLDMERIVYGRVKKVGASTTDLRFREPEQSAKRLGIKPEDDYVAFPSEDKSKILLVRVGSVVTRENIERELGTKFLAPGEFERIVSAVEDGRRAYLRRAIGRKTRFKKFRKK